MPYDPGYDCAGIDSDAKTQQPAPTWMFGEMLTYIDCHPDQHVGVVRALLGQAGGGHITIADGLDFLKPVFFDQRVKI